MDRDKARRPAPKQPRPDGARLVFKGTIFELWQWQQELFDGSFATFESLRRPDTVLVLPVCRNGNLLFVRELHPGKLPKLRTLSGRVETGETPEQTAQRELREEIGLAADEFRLWDAWQPVDKIDWAVYLFVAHNLTQVSKPRSDPGEIVSVHPIPTNGLFEDGLACTLDDPEFVCKLFETKSSPRKKARVLSLLSG